MANLDRSIQQIRKTAAQLYADNATLQSGQLAIESDTKKGKIGPGAFRDLPYADFNVRAADADYANDQRDGEGGVGGYSPVQRTGSAIAFDVAAIYNTPSTPTNSTVSFDLSGAQAGTEVVAYLNNAAEPTWPSNVYRTGQWNNGQLNSVRFIYIDASNISAAVNSNNVSANIGLWQTVRKGSTTTRASTTTLADDPDLKVPMLANKTYAIRAVIFGTSSAAADYKYRVNGPASPSSLFVEGLHTGASGTTPPANYFENTYSAADKVFLLSISSAFKIELNITISNGANAGDFVFQWAQNTSDPSTTSTRYASYINYMQCN